MCSAAAFLVRLWRGAGGGTNFAGNSLVPMRRVGTRNDKDWMPASAGMTKDDALAQRGAVRAKTRRFAAT